MFTETRTPRPKKAGLWAAVFLVTIVVGSMAMVFYLATHKEPGHPTQGAGNSGIYFSALQGTSGTSTINRMDKTSHALLWQHAVDGLDSFVIAGDALYVSAYDQDTGHGYVYALNAKNGSVRWRADLGPHDFMNGKMGLYMRDCLLSP